MISFSQFRMLSYFYVVLADKIEKILNSGSTDGKYISWTWFNDWNQQKKISEKIAI